LLNVNTTY